jgi:hypothetical protein
MQPGSLLRTHCRQHWFQQNALVQSPPLNDLANALGEARRFLETYGYQYVVNRLISLERQAERGDASSAIAAVGEATGGMGSLKDIYLYPGVDGPIADHEETNRRLQALIRNVEHHARAVAALDGIKLVR